MDTDVFPQYLRIALDVAEKIAAGELEERQRLSGRSLLASEYAVSPETVRKALRLLANMKVVEVREKSGVVSSPGTTPGGIWSSCAAARMSWSGTSGSGTSTSGTASWAER